MSDPVPRQPQAEEDGHPKDGVEDIVTQIPFVLPLVGGVLIFLLAFIAINLA